MAFATSQLANTAVSATSKPIQTWATACGPYPGWIRSYVVQPGDTLYRIAVIHGISVDVLRRANCKTGTVIYAGERLWVPFALPPPTALTIIPTFDTPTNEVTPTSSPTPTPTVAS
jgi:LysM repeat protein